jgi:ATP-dependent RNA helicase DHX57
MGTIREITSLRHEFLTSLATIYLIPYSSSPTDSSLNKNSASLPLLKSIILAGLWPHVARVHLPKSAIKFDKVQAGTVRRENSAKEWKMFDLKESRVFLHPGSVCFGNTIWKSGMVAYFTKFMTGKVFLKDATEVSTLPLCSFC